MLVLDLDLVGTAHRAVAASALIPITRGLSIDFRHGPHGRGYISSVATGLWPVPTSEDEDEADYW